MSATLWRHGPDRRLLGGGAARLPHLRRDRSRAAPGRRGGPAGHHRQSGRCRLSAGPGGHRRRRAGAVLAPRHRGDPDRGKDRRRGSIEPDRRLAPPHLGGVPGIGGAGSRAARAPAGLWFQDSRARHARAARLPIRRRPVVPGPPGRVGGTRGRARGHGPARLDRRAARGASHPGPSEGHAGGHQAGSRRGGGDTSSRLPAVHRGESGHQRGHGGMPAGLPPGGAGGGGGGGDGCIRPPRGGRHHLLLRAGGRRQRPRHQPDRNERRIQRLWSRQPSQRQHRTCPQLDHPQRRGRPFGRDRPLDAGAPVEVHHGVRGAGARFAVGVPRLRAGYRRGHLGGDALRRSRAGTRWGPGVTHSGVAGALLRRLPASGRTPQGRGQRGRADGGLAGARPCLR